jgi:hypothetical protein
LNKQRHIPSANNAPIKGAINEARDSVKILLMKKLAWLIIASYTLLLLQPVMPVLMDVIAHTFWEQQHILTVHEEHGKFHVHQEMVKAGSHNHKHLVESNKYEVIAYLAAPIVTSAIVEHFYVERKIYSCYLCNYLYRPECKDYPPPKA